MTARNGGRRRVPEGLRLRGRADHDTVVGHGVIGALHHLDVVVAVDFPVGTDGRAGSLPPASVSAAAGNAARSSSSAALIAGMGAPLPFDSCGDAIASTDGFGSGGGVT